MKIIKNTSPPLQCQIHDIIALINKPIKIELVFKKCIINKCLY